MNRMPPGLFATALLVVACDTAPQNAVVELSNDHWTIGEVHWLRVVSTDSVFQSDSLGEGKKKEKYVRFTVLDTGSTPRVEWQEFGLMTSEIDTSMVPGCPGEFFPSTRLEYACTADGSIDRLLNFQKMRQNMDTLLGNYLEQVPDINATMGGELRTWALDSARLSEQVLGDPELFHRSFGLDLSDVGGSRGLVFSDPAFRFRIKAAENALCDPSRHVGFQGELVSDTFDLKLGMSGIEMLAPMLDTMRPTREPVHVTFDVCFDTVSGMPVYVEQTMLTRIWEMDIKKTTTIYRDARIGH